MRAAIQVVSALVFSVVTKYLFLQHLRGRGHGVGKEILVTAAYAERMLNRVWSAAADGHGPEASASLVEAVGAMKETAALAAAAA